MPKREFDTSLSEVVSETPSSLSPSTDAVLVSDTAAEVRRDIGIPDPMLRRAAAQTPQAAPAVRAIPTVRHLPARPPSPPPAQPERDYAYSPLLTRVTVLPWPQRYNYYQRFVLDAERYSRVRGKETPAVPFFSYIPQYSQLGREQMLFYLWFREQCRARVPMENVDFPYILLYIYEIINLPAASPADGADMMAWLWLTYRRRYPELDKYLAEWMCDYCLVHQIPAPAALAPILPEILRRASLKEFYLAPAGEADGEMPALTADALIALASDYSYRASKYYEANAAEYERHIPAAVEQAAQICGLLPTAEKMRAARAERDAFCGSLCAQTVKRRIRVEYRSFARSQELRERITHAVKLAENQLRARLKIRARLNVDGASPSVTAAVAGYFGETMPMQRQRRDTAPEREYEHLYDAPSEGIDLSLSRAIEASSWENTALLSPEFAQAQAAKGPAAPVFPPDKTEGISPEISETPGTAAPAQSGGGLSGQQRELLAELLTGGSLRAWCRRQEKRTDPAAAAAALNDYAMDVLGDVILEEDGADWQLIEDYREDIRSWTTP